MEPDTHSVGLDAHWCLTHTLWGPTLYGARHTLCGARRYVVPDTHSVGLDALWCPTHTLWGSTLCGATLSSGAGNVRHRSINGNDDPPIAAGCA